MSTPDTPSEASNQTAVIDSPGAILRAAREQRGMQREQVSSETNLSLRYVDALETDNYAILPGQAFARGYLRRYAQLLRIDSDSLVPAFEKLWQAQRPEQVAGLGAAAKPAQRPQSAVASTRAGLSGVVSGVVGDSVTQLGQQVSRISVSQLLSWGSLALLLLLLAGTFFWQDGDHSDSPAPVAIDVDSPPAAETPAVDASALPAAEPTMPMPAAEPVAATTLTPEATAPAGTPATAPVATAAAALTAPPAAATVIPVQQRPTTLPTNTPATGAVAAPAAPAPTPSVSKPVPAVPATPIQAAPVSAKPVAASPATAVPTSAASAPAATAAKPAAAQVAAQASARIDALSFSFSGKSWISVRDATGQELVYGLKGAGQLVSVSGQPPFSINIGNVAATTLTRNGKAVNLKPYTRGEIASFRLNP